MAVWEAFLTEDDKKVMAARKSRKSTGPGTKVGLLVIDMQNTAMGYDKPIWEQAIVLFVVAIGITAGVYGVVGLIVKMDDIGLHLAQRASYVTRAIGRGLVKAMPILMKILSVVGTAAMLWVGGGLIVHGLHEYHLDLIPDMIHHLAQGAAQTLPAIGPVADWVVNAIGAGIVGLIIGAIIVAVLHLFKKKH